MKRFPALFLAFFAAFASASAKTVDCGEGFVAADSKKLDGIPAVECKRLYCRDLENGRVMGKDDGTPNNGYELKNAAGKWIDVGVGDNNDHVKCFGQRKWCDAKDPGKFDPDLGIYTRAGAANGLYRGVLRNDCYYWQAQNYKCDVAKGEIAIHNGTSWTCITQTSSGTALGQSAVKARAVRRSSGIINIKVKK